MIEAIGLWTRAPVALGRKGHAHFTLTGLLLTSLLAERQELRLLVQVPFYLVMLFSEMAFLEAV